MNITDILFAKAMAGSSGGSGGESVKVVPLVVTSNNTYTAPDGKAYSPVTVNVESLFSSATVNIKASGSGYGLDIPILNTAEGAASIATEHFNSQVDTAREVPLYKGYALGSYVANSAFQVRVTGDIQAPYRGQIMILGSGTIEFYL